MGYIIAMNIATAKSKPMTAFRFAKLHGIPIKYYINYRGDTIFNCLAYEEQYYPSPYNHATLARSLKTNKTVIATSKYTSQYIKAVSIWHELGHYIDSRQVGTEHYASTIPTLFKEARASKKAIALMKKYGCFKETARTYLLQSYDTYGNSLDFVNERTYRHLIEEA